ncbi:MAG: exo-beta-N-acetylmuramidase NamZ family protein [Parachlamydiaceae bacterium]
MQKRLLIPILFILAFYTMTLFAKVTVGVDVLLEDERQLDKLKGKKIGLLTNQTAINKDMRSTFELLKERAKHYKIVALFAPEHGLFGSDYAEVKGQNSTIQGVPVYSLYNETKRPTPEMLHGIDLIIYDIQDIGSRSYTYISTLFYVMEEAAKRNIKVMVLDRPNPINGITIDGPLLDIKLRSIVGYINVPYCHGLTVGELATYFNAEYEVGCQLEVIPMKGWRRSMSFKDTELPWIPTSPHIPEADTPLYYPITGILGELGIVSIGVGYTLPFKLIGAPWIDAVALTQYLNQQNLPGVRFTPFYFRPFYGKFVNENCQGTLISVEDSLKYKPLTIQYVIIAALKHLYPDKFKEGLKKASHRQRMFNQVVGTDKIWPLLSQKRPVQWAMRTIDDKERKRFSEKRKAFLFIDYVGQSQ